MRMLFLTKSLLLFWILLTFIVARHRLPYFPIEISRAAAQYPTFFASGITGIFIVSCMEIATFPQNSWSSLFPWSGLLLLAWFDDRHYWVIHMIGVANMILGLLINTYATPWAWLWIGLACGIYILRLVIKWVVLVFIECEHHLTLQTMVQYLFSPMKLRQMTKLGLHLMYTGDFTDPLSKLGFQLGGVFQWIVFIIFISLY